MGASMAYEVDEPSWSVISGMDMDGCTTMRVPSSRCLFAADADDRSVLFLWAMYSPGSNTTSSLGSCTVPVELCWWQMLLAEMLWAPFEYCRPSEVYAC